MKNSLLLGLLVSLVFLGGSALFPSPTAAAAETCGSDRVYPLDMNAMIVRTTTIRNMACDRSYKKLATSKVGESVRIINQTDGWYKVRRGTTEGWVLAKDVKPEGVWDTKKAVSGDAWQKYVIGVTDETIEKLTAGDRALIQLMAGRVLIRVQDVGQPLYLNPSDGKLLPLSSIAQIKDILSQWNPTRVEPIKKTSPPTKKVVAPAKTTVSKPKVTGKISLSAVLLSDGRVRLHWESTIKGAKNYNVYAITKRNSDLPPSASHRLSLSQNEDTFSGLKKGVTYWFSIYAWDGRKNVIASNRETVTIPKTIVTEPQTAFTDTEELRLYARVHDNAVTLTWTKRGAYAFQNYKIVRSETDDTPYYPKTAAIATLADRKVTSFTDNNTQKNKTYYYRICSMETSAAVTCGNVLKVTVE
ncbi:MAG: SH3 domain-containing protein [bacterium]|nr:SH3 domain-containing protein [bacterium]